MSALPNLTVVAFVERVFPVLVRARVWTETESDNQSDGGDRYTVICRHDGFHGKKTQAANGRIVASGSI